MTKFGVLTMAALVIGSSAIAHDYAVGNLVIAHPFSLETAATAQTGAGYFEITNNGETADRLIAVAADFPRVMMHQSVMEDDVAMMKHVMGGVEIAPGETLSFAPGGYHVMFMGLNGDPFEAGEAFPATLMFENAGAIEITFNVEKRPEMDADHANH